MIIFRQWKDAEEATLRELGTANWRKTVAIYRRGGLKLKKLNYILNQIS